MVRAEHLSKHFAGVRAVDDLSFTVNRGEVVGFLGPNGAGKTTTLRMLAEVFPPSAGRASIDGHDVGLVDWGRTSWWCLGGLGSDQRKYIETV